MGNIKFKNEIILKQENRTYKAINSKEINYTYKIVAKGQYATYLYFEIEGIDEEFYVPTTFINEMFNGDVIKYIETFINYNISRF
jgi:glutaredoxin